MPFNLPLPKKLRNQGWKVKIRENERLEDPHVTVICREREWRINLRDGTFLEPPGGSWNDIDSEIRNIVEHEANWSTLQREWNEKYPTNPIAVAEGE